MEDSDERLKAFCKNRIGLREYIKRQRESGNCINEMKATLKTCFQLSCIFGLCYGPFVCYKYKFFLLNYLF